MLEKRCKEWVEIQDNANPIFEIIEKTIINPQNLTNKAANGATDDPTSNQMAASGYNDDLEEMKGKSGAELIQMQRAQIDNQDVYFDQIEAIVKHLKYEN